MTDLYWQNTVRAMLDRLGHDRSYQERILQGDLGSIRAALKGSIFETMPHYQLATVVATARQALGQQPDEGA